MFDEQLAHISVAKDEDRGVIRVEAIDLGVGTKPRWFALELNYEEARALRDEIGRQLESGGRITAKLVSSL